METSETIIRIIGAIAFSGAMLWVSRSSKKTNVRSKDHRGELRLHKLYLYCGAFFMILVVACLVNLIFDHTYEYLLVAAVCTPLFATFAVPSLLTYNRHRLFFNETYLRVNNWKNKSVEINWSEIKDVTFEKYWGFIVVSDGKRRVRISKDFVGLIEFIKALETHTSYRALELKIPGF